MPPKNKKNNTQDKYAPKTWGGNGFGTVEDLETPSGQLCLVRRPGLEGLIKAGVLHNLDSLTALVDQDIAAKESGREIDIKAVVDNPEMIENLIHTVDRVICHCVLKPEVVMAPNDVTSRKDDVIYADMVDLTDKMFIFNYVVGGTRDLERFREQLDESMGSLDNGSVVQDEAE